jgi:hypothetical protein
MTTHDDSLLFVAGVVILLSWALARGGVRAWLTAALGCAHLFFAMAVNNRRLAWIELLAALVVGYLLLPSRGWRRRANRWLLAATPVLAAYALAGWESDAPVFAPIRALSTSGSDEDASSLARLEEMRNLMYTLEAAGNPLLGVGWGQPYQKVTSVYANFDASWSQYLYMPHNSLLAVAVFGGLLGMFGIWMVVPVSAFLATRGYRASSRPSERAAAMAALCVLPAYGVQCYGDIGFQSLTGALLLAASIAAAGRVAGWSEASMARRTSHGRPGRAWAPVTAPAGIDAPGPR